MIRKGPEEGRKKDKDLRAVEGDRKPFQRTPERDRLGFEKSSAAGSDHKEQCPASPLRCSLVALTEQFHWSLPCKWKQG